MVGELRALWQGHDRFSLADPVDLQPEEFGEWNRLGIPAAIASKSGIGRNRIGSHPPRQSEQPASHEPS